MDCHVSSEDVEGPGGTLSSLLEGVDVDSPADTLAAFAALIRNDSVRYDDEGGGQEDGGTFLDDHSDASTEVIDESIAQVVCKLLSPHGPGGSGGVQGEGRVQGEIKVLGPQDGTGFSRDQVAAAQLLSYLFSHAMSVAGRMRKLGSEVLKGKTQGKELQVSIDKSYLKMLTLLGH